jgi:hypothetical protein
MARILDDNDIRILQVLAPECSEMICSGSGVEFRSILPPVANHYSGSDEDFRERLMRISDTDLRYLLEKMRTGEESVGCIPPELAEVLVEVIQTRVGKSEADEVMNIYETMDEC